MELPVLGCEPVCPAALAIAGASASQRGVVCRAMQQDVERDDGTALGMSAGRYGFFRHEAEAGVYLNLKSDPSSVVGFCHGNAVPVVTDDEREFARASYTYCPVWQAEKDRIAEGRDQLVIEQQPEPTAMVDGVPVLADTTFDEPSPWDAIRRDVQLFEDAA